MLQGHAEKHVDALTPPELIGGDGGASNGSGSEPGWTGQWQDLGAS